MKILNLRGKEKGFTLIELIAVVAITSLIGLGAATATFQMIAQSSKNGDHTTASQQAMSAIHWISRDAQMCQEVTPGGGSGFPLVLGWTGWDNSEYEVTYTIDDDELLRSYSVDAEPPLETLVARHINDSGDNTTCAFASDNVLVLKVTSTVGTGDMAVSVSKIRGIVPRPAL